ncbi:MAG: putative AAA+ superfamily ATPase [Flavobacteriales bacterium]|jgi:predicted AAA+ superfamily ATPase
MLCRAICDVDKVKRQFINKFVDWKIQSRRKPILLDGDRQTGKSHLLEQLVGAHFTQVNRLAFMNNLD